MTTTSGDGRPAAAGRRGPRAQVLRAQDLPARDDADPAAGHPGAVGADPRRGLLHLADDRPPGPAGAGRRGPAAAPAGQGHLRRPPEDRPAARALVVHRGHARRGLRADLAPARLATEPADDDVAERLAVEPGGPVVRLERLRLADGEPMAVERAGCPPSGSRGSQAHLQAARVRRAARGVRRRARRGGGDDRDRRRPPPSRRRCSAPRRGCRCCCSAGRPSTPTGGRSSTCARSTAATASSSSPASPAPDQVPARPAQRAHQGRLVTMEPMFFERPEGRR